MNISIIIPTFNRARLLEKCLFSLARQDYSKENFEVIICDDGSTDNTRQISQRFIDNDFNIRYLYQEHKGVSAARNLGIKNAYGDTVVFIDDDCLPNATWLRNLGEIFRNNPDIEIVQGMVYPPNGKSVFFLLYQLILEEAYKEKVLVYGPYAKRTALFFGSGNAAIRKKTILDNDLFFDEALNTNEDLDLYRRISNAGIQIIFSEKACVEHHFQGGFIHFWERYFSYGRGYCLLSSKWPESRYKFQPPITIKLMNICKRYGLLRAFFIFIALKFKDLIWQLGYKYEEFRTEYVF